MEAYTGFAEVYDQFMDNVPYGEWSNYLVELLKEYGVPEGLVVDMGCGTGNMTEQLWKAGYDMIGIDNAEEMLEIARDKAMEKDMDILYLLQDMREMELFGTAAAIVSVCDSINYVIQDEDLLKVFRLVNNYLDKDGIFIFDLNTKYKYETILSQNTFAENRENCSFIWDNYYYPEKEINEYDLTIYIKEEEETNVFYRFDEEHYQRAYDFHRIKELLKEAGLNYITAFDAFTKNPPKENSERIYIVAREGRQEGKLYLSGSDSH